MVEAHLSILPRFVLHRLGYRYRLAIEGINFSLSTENVCCRDTNLTRASGP